MKHHKMNSNKETGNRKRNPEVVKAVTINAKIDKAFDYIAPINLMHIFRGNALIPAIIDTSVKQGWNNAGMQRTVHFADGSTSQESLLTVDDPFLFPTRTSGLPQKSFQCFLIGSKGNGCSRIWETT